jgi:hypothetical protein
MTKDPQDQEYLGLFKPKGESGTPWHLPAHLPRKRSGTGKLAALGGKCAVPS